MDELPKKICSSCVYKSVSWYSFKQQCEQSDIVLRSHLCYKNNDNKQSEIVEEEQFVANELISESTDPDGTPENCLASDSTNFENESNDKSTILQYSEHQKSVENINEVKKCLVII